jgi:hypothetical protein
MPERDPSRCPLAAENDKVLEDTYELHYDWVGKRAHKHRSIFADRKVTQEVVAFSSWT